MAKKKTPTDINQLAKFITDQTTEEKPVEEKPLEREKNAAAVSLGRLGGLRGGKARLDKLSPERRKEIAQLAASARWKKTKS